MENNINIKCDDLKQDILDVVDKSNLPIAIIYYIFKDTFNEIEKSYIAYINGIRIRQNENKQLIKNKKEA